MKRASTPFDHSSSSSHADHLLVGATGKRMKRHISDDDDVPTHHTLQSLSCLPQSIILHILDFVAHFSDDDCGGESLSLSTSTYSYHHQHDDSGLSSMPHTPQHTKTCYDHWYPISLTQQFSKNHIEIGYFRNDPTRRAQLLTRHLLLGPCSIDERHKWRVMFALRNCCSVAFDCRYDDHGGNDQFKGDCDCRDEDCSMKRKNQKKKLGNSGDDDDNGDDTSYDSHHQMNRRAMVRRQMIHLLSLNSNLETVAFLQTDAFIISWIEQMMCNKAMNDRQNRFVGVTLNAIDHLKRIFIHSAPHVTHKSISLILNSFHHLKQLFIRNVDLSELSTPLYNGQWSSLSPSTCMLERIDLSGTRVNDQVVLSLLDIESIRAIDLCHMKHLNPRTIEQVCAHVNLTSLSLESMHLSNVAFKLLAQNTSLRRLSLRYSNLSNQVLQWLISSVSIQELRVSCSCFVPYSITFGLDDLVRNSVLQQLDLSGWIIENVSVLVSHTSLTKLVCGDEVRSVMKKMIQLDPLHFTQTKLQSIVFCTNDVALAMRDCQRLRSHLPEHVKVEVTPFPELQDFGCTETESSVDNFM